MTAPKPKEDLDGLVEVSERSIDEKIRDFGSILEDIDSIDDKVRRLWRDTYENAIADRQNSYVMFTQLFGLISNKSTEWAVHGKTLTGCVERMQKANEQLLRLADLIAQVKKRDDQVNPEELFDQIKNRR